MRVFAHDLKSVLSLSIGSANIYFQLQKNLSFQNYIQIKIKINRKLLLF
jgi:hypothetical protein